MKFYRESLRRLFAAGISVGAVALIASIAVETQDCLTQLSWNTMQESIVMFNPVLLGYVYVGTLLLAHTGFSFLQKRSESDFYHSLPLTRRQLYWSVTLAALTYVVATVVLSTLAVTAVHLVTGRSFVPSYPLLNALNCIAITILVFSASAIALSLTGTNLSAVALSFLILGLPRFVLFIIGRTSGILTGASFHMMDYGILLHPLYNAATAPLVLTVRESLTAGAMELGPTAYSLMIGVLELMLGGYAFQRRRSELAERDAVSDKQRVILACLCVLPLMLLVASGRLNGSGFPYFSRLNFPNAALILLSLMGFLIYFATATKSLRRTLRLLPYYAFTLVMAVCVMLLSIQIGKHRASFCPTAQEIRSVQFLPKYEMGSPTTYRAIRISEVSFTDADVLDLTANALQAMRAQAAVDDHLYHPDEAPRNFVTLPVRLVMADGTKHVRNITFSDRDVLENLRRKNPDYVLALGSSSPQDKIGYLEEFHGRGLTAADIRRLHESILSEYPKTVLSEPVEAYEPRLYPDTMERHYDFGLVMGGFSVGGYRGTKRFVDTYYIVPELEKTCSLWMELVNNRAEQIDARTLQKALSAALAKDDSRGCYFDSTVTLYNVDPTNFGGNRMASLSFYANEGYCEFSSRAQSIFIELMRLIEQGKPTDDATGISLELTYWVTNQPGGSVLHGKSAYLGFDSETEARVVELFQEWEQLSMQVDALTMQPDAVYLPD